MANIFEFKFINRKRKKTAMQEYINDLQNLRKDMSNSQAIHILDLCIEKATLHLLQEKQQIVDANNVGFKACRKNIAQNAEDYYNETFENK